MYLNYEKYFNHIGDNDWINNHFLELFDETEKSLKDKIINALENPDEIDIRTLSAVLIAYVTDFKFFNLKNKLEVYQKLLEDDIFYAKNVYLLAKIIENNFEGVDNESNSWWWNNICNWWRFSK